MSACCTDVHVAETCNWGGVFSCCSVVFSFLCSPIVASCAGSCQVWSIWVVCIICCGWRSLILCNMLWVVTAAGEVRCCYSEFCSRLYNYIWLCIPWNGLSISFFYGEGEKSSLLWVLCCCRASAQFVLPSVWKLWFNDFVSARGFFGNAVGSRQRLLWLSNAVPCTTVSQSVGCRLSDQLPRMAMPICFSTCWTKVSPALSSSPCLISCCKGSFRCSCEPKICVFSGKGKMYCWKIFEDCFEMPIS